MKASLVFEYPAVLTAENEGGFVITFPDFPEAITQGDDEEEALSNAEDSLDEAVANRIAMGMPIPTASPLLAGQYSVTIPAGTAVKAAFYSVIADLHLTKVELALELGLDEKEVRRLLDPYHPSKLNRIDDLLRLLGKRLTIQLCETKIAATTVRSDSSNIQDAPKTWDAKPATSHLYVMPKRSDGPRHKHATTQAAS
jgi:antitoxin HicB